MLAGRYRKAGAVGGLLLMAQATLFAAQQRELTPEECLEFEEYLNGYENYGFLLSEYDDPSSVDLDAVYYVGAGIRQDPFTEGEQEIYQEEIGEIFTDVTKLTTDQINRHLEEKTGLTLDEMEHPLTWPYVEELDTYYHQAGDTNWYPVTCTGGTAEEDGRYRVCYDYGYGLCGEVLLEAYEDGYRFLENHLQWEEESETGEF